MKSFAKTLLLLPVASVLPNVQAASISTGDTGYGTPLASNNVVYIQSAPYSYYNFPSGSLSVAIGAGNASADYASVALGVANQVYGDFGVALGVDNMAGGINAVAVGRRNYVDYWVNAASYDASVAFGFDNVITGGSTSSTYSMAFGLYNYLSYAPSSGAYGSFISLSSNDTFAVGQSITIDAPNASAFGVGINNSTSGSTMIGPSDSAKVTILSSGNVGIGLGNASPSEKLHVSGNIKLTGNLVTSSGTVTLPASGTLLATSGSGSTTRLAVGGGAALNSSWGGGSTAIGLDNQNKVVAGYLGSTTNGAAIGGHNSALTTWADLNLIGQSLIFKSGGEVERMRINSLGYIGIGTSAPLQKLQISGPGQGTQGILLEDTSQAAGSKLWITQLRTGPSTYQIAPANDSGYANMPGFIMDRSGNVGIGTTAPAGRLHVMQDVTPITFDRNGTGQKITITTDAGANTIEADSITNGTKEFFIRTGGTSPGAISLAPGGPRAVTILTNGNVGIGTATPATKLDVNGTAQIAGNVTIKNVSGVTSVIRISPAGDIGMGSFVSGTNPN